MALDPIHQSRLMSLQPQYLGKVLSLSQSLLNPELDFHPHLY